MSHISQWNLPGAYNPEGYSHVVETVNDPTVYFCGFGSTATVAEQSNSPDFERQVHETLDKLFRALHEAGLTARDVVRRTTFVVDMTEERVETVLRIYNERFAPLSKPAASLIGISKLAKKNMQIEIECTAVRPPQ